MKLRKEWNGKYKDIPYEIHNFDTYVGKSKGWCFYLYFREPQFRPEDFERLWLPARIVDFSGRKRKYYDYCSSIIADLKWHGGITFYEKVSNEDSDFRCVKAGCDYQHYWDEGYDYGENWLEFDAKEAIDSLYELIPNINKWCFNCGAWGIEGFTSKNDTGYLCQKCFEKLEAEKLARESK